MYFPIKKSMKNAGFSDFLEKKIDFIFFSIDLAFPWQEPPAVPASFCSPQAPAGPEEFHGLHSTSAWTTSNPPGGGSCLPRLTLSHQNASFSRHRKCVLKTLKTPPPGPSRFSQRGVGGTPQPCSAQPTLAPTQAHLFTS